MGIHLPKGLTVRKIEAAVRRQKTALEDPGFCLSCGKEAEGCEPDARGYTCEHCGAARVYGAEELLLMAAL